MRNKPQKKEYSYWSKKEVVLLKKAYPKILLKNLAKFFPKRNKATIALKALSLKLDSAKLWQKEENHILAKYFIVSPPTKLQELLPKRSWKAILAQGERLGIKRKRNKPKIQVNENYFRKWSVNMAYLLGYILTDGCIIKGTYTGYSDALKFGVQKGDVDILKKIKQELESGHTISFVKNAAHLSITSQKLVDDLKNLKISYRKSLREKIPKVPNRFIKDYIRGIVDGDGSVAVDKEGYPRLNVYGGIKTTKFVRNYFVSKFKIYSKINRLKQSKDGKHYLYSIAYRANSAKTLITHLYANAPLCIDRKLRQAKECMSIKMKHRPNKYTKLNSQFICA